MHSEFQQVIEQHRQRVVTFARYSLGSPADADDIAQEVFVKLWKHWPSVDPDRRLAWLLRVTHNAVIDFVRRRQTKLAVIDESADAEASPGSTTTDAGAERDAATLNRDLMTAIQQLDDPFRSILVLRDIQGVSYSDIEASLEMSASQVKVYLHRARRKLRANKQLRRRFDELGA